MVEVEGIKVIKHPIEIKKCNDFGTQKDMAPTTLNFQKSKNIEQVQHYNT